VLGLDIGALLGYRQFSLSLLVHTFLLPKLYSVSLVLLVSLEYGFKKFPVVFP